MPTPGPILGLVQHKPDLNIVAAESLGWCCNLASRRESAVAPWVLEVCPVSRRPMIVTEAAFCDPAAPPRLPIPARDPIWFVGASSTNADARLL